MRRGKSVLYRLSRAETNIPPCGMEPIGKPLRRSQVPYPAVPWYGTAHGENAPHPAQAGAGSQGGTCRNFHPHTDAGPGRRRGVMRSGDFWATAAAAGPTAALLQSRCLQDPRPGTELQLQTFFTFAESITYFQCFFFF